MHAGGVDRLVGLLSSKGGKTREAAALALYSISAANAEVCSEVFTSMCNAMLQSRGSAAVMAALEPLYSGEQPEQEAAVYLLKVCFPSCLRSIAIYERYVNLNQLVNHLDFHVHVRSSIDLWHQ